MTTREKTLVVIILTLCSLPYSSDSTKELFEHTAVKIQLDETFEFIGSDDYDTEYDTAGLSEIFKDHIYGYLKNSYGVDLVAIYKKQYVACTDIFVFHKSEPHKGWTGSLGVLREFRREGIATALKIKAIEILLKKGVTEIRTDNEENNPMYKINVALGFEPVPFSLDYSKEI